MTTSFAAVGTVPVDQFEAVFQLPPLLLIQCAVVRTVKVLALVAVPPPATTEIVPVVAAPGTVAVICEVLSPAKVAEVPLNFTALTPMKSVPVMTTLVPVLPDAGVKPVMDGADGGDVALAERAGAEDGLDFGR